MASFIQSLIPESVRDTSSIYEAVNRMEGEYPTEIDNPDLHPELKIEQVTVSHDNTIPVEEQKFQKERKEFMREAFARFIGEPVENIHPDDIPVIAITGSGGAFKSMTVTAGYCKGIYDSGFWDCIMYMAGVSGGCLTLATYFTTSGRSVPNMIEHIKRTIVHHPADPIHLYQILQEDLEKRVHKVFSGLALKKVLDLPRGVIDTCGCIMNCFFYGGISGNWDDDHFKLSHHSKFLEGGQNPMPIYTCTRHERPWADKFDPDLPKEEYEAMLKTYETRDALKEKSEFDPRDPNSPCAWWQWFEITPFQLGCDELQAWVPTWAFGRKFVNGKSINVVPEQNFSLIIGMTGSAICAPLTTTIQTFQRSETTSTVQAKLKEFLGTLIQPNASLWLKQLLNIHPFHASYNWNYMYEEGPEKTPPGIKNSKRIQLVDAGPDNNQPLYVLTREGRNVDIAFVFDSSVDVERNVVTPDIESFGKRKGLSMKLASAAPPPQEQPTPGVARVPNTAESLREKYKNRYLQVYEMTPNNPTGANIYGARNATHPMTVAYMPILPNPEMPEFYPNDIGFGQFQYKPEEVENLLNCGTLNWKQEESRIRDVVRTAWQRKRDARLGRR
ncbi:acyl transferase/acyl hydrolase/lysophospholipase [Polychytrium aggregatum]|uniref:acyl transferase/acyl hydrolase/lysophospholipase n=1 Tax=Polychytrium aggregatum TaxID=110093 RepID=UPI0022FF05CD|nr:acyl transferase/acyl hydrolase/lysophospholipase [Polychytrium aggregatum]KAI9193612.1 acyl transferase/acyl hydrolase/lysophospholipase [Polychytrium aggregatum]